MTAMPGDWVTNDVLAEKLDQVGEHLKQQDARIAELLAKLEQSSGDRAQLNRRVMALEGTVALINPAEVQEMHDFLAWHLGVRRWFAKHRIRNRIVGLLAAVALPITLSLCNALLHHWGWL